MTYAVNVSRAFNGESAKLTLKYMQTAALMGLVSLSDTRRLLGSITRSEHERPSVLARRRKLNRYWNRASRNVADRRWVRKS